MSEHDHRAASDDEIIAAMQHLSATTAQVINWPYLARLVVTAPPALNDRERCELLVAGANGRKLKGLQWGQLLGVPLGIVPADEATHMAVDMRAHVEAQLEAVLKGGEARKRVVFEATNAAAGQVVLVPSLIGELEARVVAAGMSAAIAYALSVLCRPQHADQLRRCKLSTCRNFFFERQSRAGAGAPSRTYCTNNKQHVEAGEREQARLRMQRRRKHK